MSDERKEWTTMDGGKLWAVVPKWLAALGSEVVERGNTDPKFLRRVAKFAKSGANFIPPDERLVRAVMRNNCFLAPDWKSAYKTAISQRVLDRIGSFPWPEDVLFEKCPLGCDGEVRECHFAHYGFYEWSRSISTGMGMSNGFNLYMWMDLQPPREGVDFGLWFDEQDFRNASFASGDTLMEKWYLTHIRLVPGSLGKSREEQQKMLPEGYYAPRPIELVQKELLFRRKNGRWASIDQGHSRTGEQGIRIGPAPRSQYLLVDGCDNHPSSEIGIGASRSQPASLDYATLAELEGREEE